MSSRLGTWDEEIPDILLETDESFRRVPPAKEIAEVLRAVSDGEPHDSSRLVRRLLRCLGDTEAEDLFRSYDQDDDGCDSILEPYAELVPDDARLVPTLSEIARMIPTKVK